MRQMMNETRLGTTLAALVLIGSSFSSTVACSRHTGSSKRSVLESLAPQIKGHPSNISYVIRFSDAMEARSHENELRNKRLSIEHLDQSGRIFKINSPTSELVGLEVPSTASLSLNTPITLRPADSTPPNTAQDPSNNAAEAFLTARNETGVQKLIERMPTADGRGVKVAVLDTGIDFGIDGLYRFPDGSQKLEGFYDLTDFGKVHLTPVTADFSGATYTLGGKSVKFAPGVVAAKVLATGLLDESVLARDYLSSDGVDLDGNGSHNDTFPFVSGLNAKNTPTVWIDLNNDGIFGTPGWDEELTDFNTTYKYVLMNPGASPSGARPLAVTLTSEQEVQFHSTLHDHGTSCAIIVAGDGYANGSLRGMAPKAKLISMVIDAVGQDVYTLDQFMKMFLKARDLGADAISVSWGFATGDLASARFVADFLDQEVASHGVLIGIAAGNDGPGTSSGSPDDYIPRRGLGVGAYVSETQAANVYGWTGVSGNSVIWYSSHGPTRGGRQIPDLVSPLATLVRSARGTHAPQFYPFSGTSSATPAAIGASAALMSAAKQMGETRIDPRLLKLALQASASQVPGVPFTRQGAGLIDVSRALDIYLKLARELKAAQSDPNKRQPFAVELKARIALEGSSLPGEGIHYSSYRNSVLAKVEMSEDSQKLLDPLTYIEPLEITHSSKFLTTPSVLAMQSSGANFTIRFDAAELSKPGVYTDTIELKRSSDGLTLLRIPVVFEIPASPDSTAQITTVDQSIGPFDLWRLPVKLEQPSSLVLDGMILEAQANRGASLGFGVRNAAGLVVYQKITPHSRPSQSLLVSTHELPAGQYEVFLFRNFSRPAVLSDVRVTATLRLPYLRGISARFQNQKLELGVQALSDLTLSKAELTIQSSLQVVELTKDTQAARPGYSGSIELPRATDHVQIQLAQNKLDQLSEKQLHHSLAFIDAVNKSILFRGWVGLSSAKLSGDFPKEVDFSSKGSHLQILSYPNISNWKEVKTQSLWLSVATPLETPITVNVALSSLKPAVGAMTQGQVATIPIAIDNLSPEQKKLLDSPWSGRVLLRDNEDQVIGIFPVRNLD